MAKTWQIKAPSFQRFSVDENTSDTMQRSVFIPGTDKVFRITGKLAAINTS
jgi:hypothetical protein